MSQFDTQLRRGALVNLVGLAAKLVYPLFFVLATWLFGPDAVGLYFLAIFNSHVAVRAVSSGFNDATTIYASYADAQGQPNDKIYQVLANGLTFALGLSFCLVLLAYFGIDSLVAHVYDNRPGLSEALWVASLSLPCVALSQVAIASTKSLMRMEYDAALNGFVKPISLLGFSLIAWWQEAGAIGLVWSHVAMQAVMAVLGVWAMLRHFEARRIMRAIVAFDFDAQLLKFAVPQNLYMTFNKYLTRLDVMMLAVFGFNDAMIAFYSAGALITSNVREVRVIFSQAFGPIAARHHAAQETEQFEEVLSRICRWTTSIATPILLVILILRNDVLTLIDASYVYDSTFMAILLLPPFFTCAFGLAGNSIVYCGHSVWNLFNSLLVAGLNTLFNWLLIPEFGLSGAAMATAGSACIIAGLQVVELWCLEGIRIRMRAIWKPLLGGAVVLTLVCIEGDPATIGGALTRSALALAAVGGFLFLMAVLRHEEVNLKTIRNRLGFRTETS
ncbi:MAG: oligosaccharide flippase family protein [Myxococcota bacterium]|nr:oligosaccharide flippase family protein [Myxococcota bacterium]